MSTLTFSESAALVSVLEAHGAAVVGSAGEGRAGRRAARARRAAAGKGGRTPLGALAEGRDGLRQQRRSVCVGGGGWEGKPVRGGGVGEEAAAREEAIAVGDRGREAASGARRAVAGKGGRAPFAVLAEGCGGASWSAVEALSKRSARLRSWRRRSRRGSGDGEAAGERKASQPPRARGAGGGPAAGGGIKGSAQR
ncbi:hypothetical protein PVAP13_1NG285233 [Panicum virgatum]|uniref:Uncharacterized protein n=1 Tax=Panicum virgatum TaxID=38727 RepID=A0A8T0WVV5_PANVG|nr:hypothetical protein PVAP13_1NG285233 [Panicum virgatum]